MDFFLFETKMNKDKWVKELKEPTNVENGPIKVWGLDF